MSIADKVQELKKIISLVCDVVPQIVVIVKDLITLFKTV